jgi:hypothetical protein
MKRCEKANESSTGLAESDNPRLVMPHLTGVCRLAPTFSTGTGTNGQTLGMSLARPLCERALDRSGRPSTGRTSNAAIHFPASQETVLGPSGICA